jgi:hypothetical protein
MNDVEQVEQQGLVLVRQAGDIAVRDASTFQQAGLFLRTVSGYIRKVGEVLDPIVESAHKAHKIAVDQRKKLLEPAQSAERIVKAEMARFEQADRQRVLEEQRRLDADRRRLEDEERLANATRLEAAGKSEAAERALTAPVAAPVFVPPARPIVSAEGVSFRDNWDFEIEDAALLPREYLIPDEKKIRAVVKAHKGETKIPGVKVIHDRSAAVRS